MKNLMNKFVLLGSLFVSLLFVAPSITAQESEAKMLSIINPTVSNGIQVGDVLSRKVAVEVNLPYQISQTALPMKGERRNGLELTEIKVDSTQHDNRNIVTIALHYQVFASAAKPVVMQLPEENFAFTGGAKAMAIKVPAWNFWFSPLVADGISNAKENLQPQFKPTLVDINVHHTRFMVLLGLFITGLVGLIYINADRRWLPFMNGAFAQAHRNLKKLPKKQIDEKKALIYMHQAFNTVHGENLFASEVEQFLAAHPEFYQFKTSITAFFERSNASLFASQQQSGEQFINDLIGLSKSLRDCERGI
jgi:mxaA protein